MSACEVSVIVPIYNAEEYLDECIRSIAAQTFQNIEILLVVQRGQDRSLEMSHEWEKRDKRIRVIVKEEKDRGCGPARDTGVENACGEYVCFVDADDTVSADFVEKMLQAVKDSGADIGECDYMKVRMATQSREYVSCTCIMGKKLDKKERIRLGGAAFWKLIIRKNLLLENGIRQPNVYGEDIAIYPFLLQSANKIVGVEEALYFYRKGAKGSTTSQGDNHIKLLRAFEALIDRYKNAGIYEKYADELQAWVRRWMSRDLSLALTSLDDRAYAACLAEFNQYFKRTFQQEVKNEMLLGSYNLSRIVNKLDYIENPYNRINFSSIIAIADEGKYCFEITHKNRYREIMLQREKDNGFWNIMENIRPQFLFMDLLEERHDLVKISDRYITKSDAFDDAVVTAGCGLETVSRDSDECSELWERSFALFAEKVSRYIPLNRVIVVENYLTEAYSDGNAVFPFEDMAAIQKINGILNKYYRYIKDKYPQMIVVEAYKAERYCTDIKYEYGCYPWHLNEWANIEIARMITQAISS